MIFLTFSSLFDTSPVVTVLNYWKYCYIKFACCMLTGELLNQLKQLDRDVTRSLLDVSRKLNVQDVNPFLQYKKLLLYPAGQRELDSLVSSIQEGIYTLIFCNSFSHIQLKWNDDKKMLKRRKESDTYLATVCRCCWSIQITMKIDKLLELSASTVIFFSWWRPQCWLKAPII